MLRVSVVRAILSSRISASALETSKPSAIVDPMVVAFKSPRRVSSMSALLRGLLAQAGKQNQFQSLGGLLSRKYRNTILSGEDSLGIRVEVEAPVAKKADKCQPSGLGELDGEAGGRRHGGNDRHPRSVRFLDNFEARAARDHQDRVG